MTIEQLKEEGALYFSNIRTGLQQYENKILTLDEQPAFEILDKMWKKNGLFHAFVDFYYFSMDDKARVCLEAVLSEEELTYLGGLRAEKEQVVFPLDDMLLKIAVKWNARELLFSTFYFTGERSTWWGNYNQEYVVFTEK